MTNENNIKKLPTACAEGFSLNSLARELQLRIKEENKAYRKGKELSNFLQVDDPNAKREGTSAYTRFQEAVAYIALKKSVTPEQLINNTSYTKADLKHDMAKGYISFAPSH